MAGAVIAACISRPKKGKGALLAKTLFACWLACLSAQSHAAVFSPQSFTLANGMQVVVIKNSLSPAVAHMVWYKAGAVDDPAGLSGTAHYLEHMMFKGTPHMPDGLFSATVAALGGEDNAFTTMDYTAYHETLAAEHLGLAMAMEADRMRGLSLDPGLAQTEKAVVISERQERTDNSPQGLFREKMAATLYGNHPYGRPVIGTKEDLARLSRDNLAAFYARYYAPSNAILVVSGNVEARDVVRLADATYGRLSGPPALSRAALPPLEKPKAARVEMQDKRITQPVLIRAIALDRGKVSLARSDALEVLSEVLSGGEVGILYRHFVAQKRTASGIDASFGGLSRGPSSFSISATPVPGQDVRALERDVEAFMKKLAAKGIDAKAVAAAKKRLLDSAVFARDKLSAPAQIFGALAAIDRPLSDVEAWPSRIASIKATDVDAALRFVLASPYNVTGILEPEAGPP